MHQSLFISRQQALAAQIKALGLTHWLQPVADEFQGEYPASYAQRLQYLTGFSGSAGVGIFAASGVSQLLVDGRYTLQAAQELKGQSVVVHQTGEISLSGQLALLPSDAKIGFDAWLHTQHQLQQLQRAIASTGQTLVATKNLVDTVWNAEQPLFSAGAVSIQPLEWAGQRSKEKLSRLRAQLSLHHAEGVVVAMPDACAWLLNIRGSDIPYNPLALGYMLVTQDRVYWHTFSREISSEVAAYLSALKVTLCPLEAVWRGEEPLFQGCTHVAIDAAYAPAAMWECAAREDVVLLHAEDSMMLAKACKNEAELNGMRLAHARDGRALTRALFAISQAEAMDELAAEAALEHARRQHADYLQPSFATIAGAGEHGAIVHYRVNASSNRPWQEGELLLLDSGAQYPYGTTDVTRVLVKGEPNAEMKDRYTRVLKGHIALATAQFPAGTSGSQLDALARQYLWEIGCDFDHGTGHGVGAYLCVHEGPQRISKRGGDVPLHVGMVLSNEPGFYKAAAYGIRIENLVVVESRGTSADGRTMLGFETLTLAPIDTTLIEQSLLSASEKAWLNAYHERVRENMKAETLSAAEHSWLTRVTAPI